MAELKKRRDYNRPLTQQEVDGNWDELDRRTKTQRELNTIDKLAGHIESMEESGGETPTLQEVIEAGNTYEVKSIFGGVEGIFSIQAYWLSQKSSKRVPSLSMTEQDNMENRTVFTSEGVLYERGLLREKRIAFPFGVKRSSGSLLESIFYFPLSINGKFADEFGAVLIPETIIIPISNGNVEIGEVFGHRFLRNSKLVGFELLCEDAPTGDSIGVNLLIDDSQMDTKYIPDSETLSGESSMEDNPLEVYRGDKVSFDVFGIGSTDPGTNLRGVLKFIELEQTQPSGSSCIINNIYSVYETNDGENDYWVIKPGLPQEADTLTFDSFDFDIELKFSDDTSEIVNYDRFTWGSLKTLQKELTAVTIVDAIVLSSGELYLHGRDDNGYSAVENVIYVENDIHADSITNESSWGKDYVRLNFLIDTVCEI